MARIVEVRRVAHPIGGHQRIRHISLVTMRRLRLSHLPTPLYHNEALDDLVGTELWVKMDDSNAGPASGNKIRKLEFLLAQAIDERARTVITCGGEQSNHARATAIAAANLGLSSLLLLRTSDPARPPALTGNLLLNRLAGAELRFISVAEYAVRDALMVAEKEQLRARGERAYIIPEGGSNGLGAMGWAEAMREVRGQLDLGLGGGPKPFDAVVHACGSGGTAAGCVLGGRLFGVANRVVAMAVCDDTAYFDNVIHSIVTSAQQLDSSFTELAALEIHDEWKGPAYAVADTEQLKFITDVARCSGLMLDPVYTGKALFGLSRMTDKPKRTLFLHTGGLPGLLAQAADFAQVLSQP
jgi:D-cysteine desulfhydrase